MGITEHLTARRVVAGLALLALTGLAAGYGVAVRARPKPLTLRPPAAAGKATPAPKLLYVHVAGAVRQPGVYRLPDGTRVGDAVAAAGGPSPDAELDALNLASRVRDGDKVLVPAKGTGAATGATTGQGTRINLNTATASDLDALPGIGPALAARIVAYRESNGGFRTVRDLTKVPGIGARKFADLEDKVTV